VLQGNLAEAEREARAALAMAPNHYLGKSLKAMIAAARDDRTAALAHIRSFEQDGRRNHWAALRIAMIHARLGDKEQAIEWIGRAAELGNHSWYALVKHPWFASLQSEPAFQELVSRIRGDLDDVRDDVVGVYQLLCR
jgi:tetratricopeptide (TPR) repeat protein